MKELITFILILIIAPCTIIGAYEVRDYLQENLGEQFETEIQPIKWTKEIAVISTNDGCPCAYEVWTAPVYEWGIDEEGWYIEYKQNDCK